jgi:hypothetical protein
MKQKKPKSKAALTEYIYVQNCNIFTVGNSKSLLLPEIKSQLPRQYSD